jgi:hypothetical protein
MKIESRTRWTDKGTHRLKHYDLLFIAENEEESKALDMLGQPGSFVQGEIRLADGYGEHYLMVQPRMMLQVNQDLRLFPEVLTKPKGDPQ